MKDLVMRLPGMKRIFANHLAQKLKKLGVSTEGIETIAKSSPPVTQSEKAVDTLTLGLPVCRPEDVKPGPNRIRQAYGFGKSDEQLLISVVTPPKSLLSVDKNLTPQVGKTVESIMSRHVACIQADTPVNTVLDFALNRKIQELPVIDQELRFLGVFSCQDFLVRLQEALSQGTSLENLWQVAVCQQLYTPIPTVTPDTSLSDAAKCMRQYRLRQLYVLHDQKIKGVLQADALIVHRLSA